MATNSGSEYIPITELAGDLISEEQIQRMVNRYVWAGETIQGLDVLEAGCGSGQGLEYLAKKAKSLAAGDYSDAVLQVTTQLNLPGTEIRRFDAQEIPYPNGRFDAVILFEALYYVPDPDRFFSEAWRVLRPGGTLLISTANCDLFDFNPSPHSYEYLGVTELSRRLGLLGFDTEFFGDTSVAKISRRQRVLRPLKAIAAQTGLIPKTHSGKVWLKRLVFGKMLPMPASVNEQTRPYQMPTPIPGDRPDRSHKVILCRACKRA